MSNTRTWHTSFNQPSLEGERVHVWLWELQINPQQTDALAGLLSFDERLRLSRFRFPEDQSRYLIAHATLRRLLGSYLACTPSEVSFTVSLQGKPSLASMHETIHFSLSHTKHVAVAAFSRASPLGIDIEHISRRVDLAVARHVFSEEENRSLLRLSPEQRVEGFFRCWTRKEAICKAEGCGLSEDTSRFSVSLGPGELPRILSMGGVLTRAWSLSDLPASGDLIGALAIAAPTSEIDYFTLPEEPPL